MARARRRPNSTLIDDLFRRPEAYELFQAIRIIERLEVSEAMARGEDLPDPVGRGVDPRRAALATRSNLSLRFASSEVDGLRRLDNGKVEITQSVIGLVGPSGVLPLALSELVQASVRQRNPGLRAFLDLFADRLTSLLYDAWAKPRIVLETERRPVVKAAAIDTLLRALVGVGFPRLSERMAFPDSGLVHHGGLLSRQARSAHAVEQILSSGLRLPVRIDQFVGEWVLIAPEDRTRLGGPGSPKGSLCRLDDEAVIGERTWITQGAVRLCVGPLDYAGFASLLPNGAHQQRLRDLAAYALGADTVYRLRLTLKAEEVPALRLGGAPDASDGAHLGWNTWLGGGGPRTTPGVVDLDLTSALQIH